MNIVDLRIADDAIIRQIAEMLLKGFATSAPDSWPNLDAAEEEVRASLGEGHISRVALAEDGAALGWIGANSQYDGNVWELHPLVVRVDQQGKGIGRALVVDLEARVRALGGLTIILGTDDEMQQTTLGGVNLLPDVWEHVARIRNLKRHPYEFYQKMGYTIVGVVPDANGIGKPDIIMAKSLKNQ